MPREQTPIEKLSRIAVLVFLAVSAVLQSKLAGSYPANYAFLEPYRVASIYCILASSATIILICIHWSLENGLASRLSKLIAHGFFWGALMIQSTVLPALADYAVSRWPRGDDGPGLGFGLLSIGARYMSLGFGVAVATAFFIRWVCIFKSKKGARQETQDVLIVFTIAVLGTLAVFLRFRSFIML